WKNGDLERLDVFAGIERERAGRGRVVGACPGCAVAGRVIDRDQSGVAAAALDRNHRAADSFGRPAVHKKIPRVIRVSNGNIGAAASIVEKGATGRIAKHDLESWGTVWHRIVDDLNVKELLSLTWEEGQGSGNG